MFCLMEYIVWNKTAKYLCFTKVKNGRICNYFFDVIVWIIIIN